MAGGVAAETCRFDGESWTTRLDHPWAATPRTAPERAARPV